jgi:crotonobetainyl-CoA:carnitine CoA-transferase CaiB-like acyl-CoA transferase
MRIELGGVPMLGSPLHMSATPVRYERPPPQLGEHTDEVTRQYGLDPALLRSQGAIR